MIFCSYVQNLLIVILEKGIRITMNFTVTSSPHIRGNNRTKRIMLDVLIALLPTVVMSVVCFGVRAILIEAVCIGAALVGEWLWRQMTKQHNTLMDGSAIVTGLLLAFTLPVSVPWWVAAIGSLFAVIVVKGMCGGLGQNMFNPALAARAFLLAVWPVHITRFVASEYKMNISMAADAVSSPTPLHEMQMQTLPDSSLPEMLIGSVGGCIGEVSALALLLGGVYLIFRKVISPRIPLAYIGSVAALTLVFSKGDSPVLWMVYSLLEGGVLLGAIFMATDYATSPVNPKGQIFYGIGAGILTVFFRYTGLFPEGVTYAILLMNAAVWLIDQKTAPRRFGWKKGAA